jgi:hypothetical protein
MPGNDVLLTANFQSTTNLTNPQANASSLKVYPNPTNGFTTLEFPGSTISSATIELFNMMGQTVFTKQIESNDSGQETLDLSYLEKGLYWVLFRTGEKIFSTPLQIVK